jgi:hypothetical protein
LNLIPADTKARKIAPHAGVVKSVLRLFDELAKCDTEGILKEVRDAAEGNVERFPIHELEVAMMEIFDLETITVNKRGEKTKKQIKSMKVTTSPWLWWIPGLLLFGLFALVGAINPGVWKSAWWLLPVVEFIPFIRGYAFWKARLKLLNDEVVSAAGTIAYKASSDGYVAETDDGKPVSSLLTRNMPPGKYRFYHLEQDGWSLSVEPLSSEAEFRSNLNDTIASAFGYDGNHLEHCRSRAVMGTLKTAEGLLKIQQTSDENNNITLESFTVGEVKFDISRKGCGALLENLSYRVYYCEEEEQGLVKQIAKLVKSQKKNFEAIETV